MKVLFDYQVFSIQKYGGVSRYFCEIIKTMNYSLPILVSNNYYLQKLDLKYFRFGTNNVIFKKGLSFINKMYTLIKISFLKFDIYHPTYYNPYLLNFIKKKPTVVTIHDMIHEKFPQYFSLDDPTTDRKKKMVEHADRIIAVSENTKNDIIEIFGFSADKIDVIYHGDSFSLVEPCQIIKEKIPKRYILFTGNRNGYKNFEIMFKALKKYLLRDKSLYLICAGGGEFTKQELGLFENDSVVNRVLQFNCNDGELKQLYSSSLFFIYPSIYEGFGIPLLEAMSTETPILCSRTSCFPEVADKCAIYFDPHSIKDIEEKIGFALSNELEEYKMLGTERLSHFSWENARRQTKVSYLKVLSK